MSPKVRAKRIYALKNTYSGVVGELAIAMALVRAGLRVAKPYWNDDEVDLVVFSREGSRLLPIPVQAKSLQRLDKEGTEFTIQGLKKKYVDRQPALCLGVYSVELNKLWFIPGAENIKRIHEAGVIASQTRPGRNRTAYESLGSDSDVNIYVNLTPEGDIAFDHQWAIDTESPAKLSNAIQEVAKRFSDTGLDALLDSFMAEDDNDAATSATELTETDQNG